MLSEKCEVCKRELKISGICIAGVSYPQVEKCCEYNPYKDLMDYLEIRIITDKLYTSYPYSKRYIRPDFVKEGFFTKETWGRYIHLYLDKPTQKGDWLSKNFNHFSLRIAKNNLYLEIDNRLVLHKNIAKLKTFEIYNMMKKAVIIFKRNDNN
jgi:hypothetical protein